MGQRRTIPGVTSVFVLVDRCKKDVLLVFFDFFFDLFLLVFYKYVDAT